MKKTSIDKRITKLRDVRGISRAVVIMLILVAVMLAVVSVPVYLHYRGVWRELKCMTSLKSANDQMIEEFLFSAGDLDIEAAKSHVGYVMNGWDDLCPGGGIVYIVKNDDPNARMPYKLVCGIHGEDAKERTRLNANYLYKKVCERVNYDLLQGLPIPESVTVNMNGEDVTARLVTEDQNVKRGTKYYDYDSDVVAYYGVAGNGSFTDTGADDGTVCYYAYLDPDHFAVWTSRNWWSGDSWIIADHSGEVLPG